MATAGDAPSMAAPGARPLVARRSGGLANWAIVLIVAAVGVVLFLMLNARRLDRTSPATNARSSMISPAAAPPPLYIPPVAEPTPPAPVVVAAPPVFVPPRVTQSAPRVVYVPSPPQIQTPPPQAVTVPVPVTADSDRPAWTVDTTGGDRSVGNRGETSTDGNAVTGGSAATEAAGLGALPAYGTSRGRARATTFAHRSTTVPEGTLIPAVLETALDSTRAGPARAMVTRDVRGFDGSKVLIPRGSRLIGEYRADLQPGQNRALVIWTRLVRPDGASIALGSPAADTLGRVVIKGKVNSHFLERFTTALLSTTLNIGAGLASRIGTDNSVAVLTLPGSINGTAVPIAPGDQVQRTLRVRQGTSITVFVTRDLDFTGVGAGR